LKNDLTPVNGKKAGTQFSTPLRGISASKVSLRSLSGGHLKFPVSEYSPDFSFKLSFARSSMLLSLASLGILSKMIGENQTHYVCFLRQKIEKMTISYYP